MEAKVAMDIAQVDGTSEFPLLNITARNWLSSQGRDVDLNEAPFKIQEEHLSRMRALSRTGKLLVLQTIIIDLCAHCIVLNFVAVFLCSGYLSYLLMNKSIKIDI